MLRVRRRLPQDLAVPVSKAFPPTGLSHDDGPGSRWDLARGGLTPHTTQAAAENPGHGWNYTQTRDF